MSQVITPNRIAAVTTWLTAGGAFAYAIVGTFPASWQPTAIIVAALATKAAVALKFMTGSQKVDALEANAQWINQVPPPAEPVPDEPVNQDYEPDYALAPEEHV